LDLLVNCSLPQNHLRKRQYFNLVLRQWAHLTVLQESMPHPPLQSNHMAALPCDIG
jgi:hypothetical protein